MANNGIISPVNFCTVRFLSPRARLHPSVHPSAILPPHCAQMSGTAAGFEAFWSSVAEGQLQRVPLLKAIEAATARVFEADVLDKIDDPAWRLQVRRVVLESNLGGLEEFGDEWYKCIKEKMRRMNLCADWIVQAMEKQAACGFDAFERAFIAGRGGE